MIRRIVVVLGCRRCGVAVSLDEALNKGFGSHRPDFRCPYCGGVCDAYELKGLRGRRGGGRYSSRRD